MPHMHEPKEHDAKWNKPDKNNKYCLIPLKWSTQGGQIQRQGMRRKEWEVNGYRISDICCLAPKLCPTFFEPMGYSTPGFPVLHYLPEFVQIHVHWICWEHASISSSVIPFFSCLQSFLASGCFPMGQLFASGGLSIGVSASASVPPMNTQDW